MTITSERQRRIAAMVAVLGSQRGSIAPGFFSRGPRGHLSRALRAAGQYAVTPGTGPGAAPERAALAALVRTKRITEAEAEAFLADRYPGQRYGGGRFADRAQSLTEAAGRPPEEVQRRAAGSSVAGSDPSSPLRIGRLPSGYEQVAVQDVIEGLAEGVAARFHQVEMSPPEFAAHSLNGSALAPGTVPPEALDLPAVGKKLLSWPSADEAIEVDIAQSATSDRWIVRTATGVSGPGRIWEARDVRPRRSARVGVGPARYRLIRAGQRFGVMSTRLPLDADMAANQTPGLLIQYGIVIRNIPHFLGRPPGRILAVEAVGDTPTSFRQSFLTGGGPGWASGGTTRDYWWNRTTRDHITLAPYPFMDAFGTDPSLVPIPANLRDVMGFSFTLVTGRDGGEVFRQLCSRNTLGRALRMSGHGPTATIPPGLPIESPTVASIVDWSGAAIYTHRVEGYDLTTAGTRVAIGTPFSYDDCVSLVPSDTHFSVVVQPIGERLLSQLGLAALVTPEEWHRSGMKTVENVSGRLRSWALDLTVD